jgi:transcriptional regulator with XRE-family HTH domain
LKKGQFSSKRLLLIAAAVLVIVAVIATPVLAAHNEDRRAADAIARFLGFLDAEQLAEYVGLEDEADEPCGPACSYYADNFAEAVGLRTAENAAERVGLEDDEEGSAEDKFAEALYGAENLRQLARALDFESVGDLVAALGVDRTVLADAFRDRVNLVALADLQALAEAEDIDEEEFDQVLADSYEDPQAFAELLGFSSLRDLAEQLGLAPRELRQLLREANPQETNKLEELAELRLIAQELGFSSLGAFADYMGVESRRELVKLLEDADTPQEVAEAFGFESVGDLAEHLGIDRDELAELLDEAKSDDGVANTDSEDEEESAGSVSQETEQEAESGDVNQSFSVTSEGDNSNQSAAVQGTANTGNAQSQTSVVQSGSEAEDIEIDEGGSSIEVSPELNSQSQQAVEQAAAAAADPEEVEQAAPAK